MKKASICLKALGLSWAFFLGAAVVDAKAQEQSIGEKVEKAVNDALRGGDPARRRSYAEKVTGIFLASGKSARSDEVLAELPSALNYHVAHVESILRKASQAGVPTEVLRLEGFDIEFDYLAARVVRALQHAPSEESKKTIEKQIDQIFDTSVSELRARFPGDGLDKLLPKTLEAERENWHAGVDSPFHSSMDKALEEGDLKAVLQGIVAAARSFPSVQFNAEDLRDPKRPGTISALDAIQKVRDAKDEATRLCFNSYGVVAERADQWEEKVERLVSEARARNPGGKFSPPSIPPRRSKAIGTAKADGVMVPTAPASSTSVQLKPDVPRTPEMGNSSILRWLAFALLLACAIGVLWMARRRFLRNP